MDKKYSTKNGIAKAQFRHCAIKSREEKGGSLNLSPLMVSATKAFTQELDAIEKLGTKCGQPGTIEGAQANVTVAENRRDPGCLDRAKLAVAMLYDRVSP